MDGNIENIQNVCRQVLEISDNEFYSAIEIAEEQKEYFNPLKCATTDTQHKLGEYNDKVINKLLELKELLESGDDI